MIKGIPFIVFKVIMRIKYKKIYVDFKTNEINNRIKADLEKKLKVIN